MKISLDVELLEGFDCGVFIESYHSKKLVDLSKCKIYPFDCSDTSNKKDVKEKSSSEPVLLEHLVSPHHNRAATEAALQFLLGSIPINDELIIIDPYFYPPMSTADAQIYSATIERVLLPFIGLLTSIKVITGSGVKQYSQLTKAEVEKVFKKYGHITMTHKSTNKVHDRFWISNQRKNGILMGSSLNGLTKKYNLIAALDPTDVASIVSEFCRHRLI